MSYFWLAQIIKALSPLRLPLTHVPAFLILPHDVTQTSVKQIQMTDLWPLAYIKGWNVRVLRETP